MLSERQEHLELAVDSDDPEEREGHRVVSKWIRHFLDVVVEGIRSADEEERHPSVSEESMNPEYMEFDSQGLAAQNETPN